MSEENLQQQLAAERDNVEQWKVQYQLKSEMFLQVSEQLAAEREKLREEKAKFHGDDYANMDAARNRILDLEQQLAAERLKYERSQEKVREYFALLAAERERYDKV